jgi:hypothetical protein
LQPAYNLAFALLDCLHVFAGNLPCAVFSKMTEGFGGYAAFIETGAAQWAFADKRNIKTSL